MRHWTEEELNKMSREQLAGIMAVLAEQKKCQVNDICPKGAIRLLVIDSILEAQEEVRGS